MKKNILILAAGKGRRMLSKDDNLSKVTLKILGKPLLNFVYDAIKPLNAEKVGVVVGYGGEQVASLLDKKAEIIWQKEILGAGNAVQEASSAFSSLEGETLILCGDLPLISSDTLNKIFHIHEKYNNEMTVVSALVNNPNGFGRIIRDVKSGALLKIKEDKDCSICEKEINEINTGILVINNKLLFEFINKLEFHKERNEYYLTDLVELLASANKRIGSFIIENNEEVFGINTHYDLAVATKIIQHRINKKLLESGVMLEDLDTAYIGPDVTVGLGTIIRPNTTILGKSTIGEDNLIGPNSYLEDCEIGNNNQILSSWLTETTIGNNNEVGPFTKMRAHTNIENNCRIGNFVELKNAHYHDGVKSAHLTYIGDCEIGSKTNIGCGTITANYDGFNKTRTKIGEECFVGSGTILVAPIEMEDKSFTAAGSTITKSVKTDTMSIARARQVDLEHGYTIFREKAKAEKERKLKEKEGK